jgi:hypothetical protein
VWLRCRLETALARIGEGRSRPRAADREKIGALFGERRASSARADLVRDTDDVAPEAMALAVAALRATGDTEIDGAGTASVSFPEFFELLRQGAA